MITAAPIHESPEDFEEIEAELLRVWREEIFAPLIEELHVNLPIQNKKGSSDKSPLEEAIATGRVWFFRGKFSGRFDSRISRELKKMGAVRDLAQGGWKIPRSKLPAAMKRAIDLSSARMDQVVRNITRKLSEMDPERIAQKMDIGPLFDRALFRVDGKLDRTLRAITVRPQMDDAGKKKLATDWSKNLDKYIVDFTKRQVLTLRERVEKSVFAGNRHEYLARLIQQRYGVTANKAKFLARQETSLMMSKYKQVRYEACGSPGYIWKCAAGSPLHPVRHDHKELKDTYQTWASPPITDVRTGRRNHPGEDYNCRCTARPVFRKPNEKVR